MGFCSKYRFKTCSSIGGHVHFNGGGAHGLAEVRGVPFGSCGPSCSRTFDDDGGVGGNVAAQESERVDVARVYLGDSRGEEVGCGGVSAGSMDGGWGANQQAQREKPRGGGDGDRGWRKKKTYKTAFKR